MQSSVVHKDVQEVFVTFGYIVDVHCAECMLLGLSTWASCRSQELYTVRHNYRA